MSRSSSSSNSGTCAGMIVVLLIGAIILGIVVLVSTGGDTLSALFAPPPPNFPISEALTSGNIITGQGGVYLGNGGSLQYTVKEAHTGNFKIWVAVAPGAYYPQVDADPDTVEVSVNGASPFQLAIADFDFKCFIH